ncbi:hypothetical protein AJ80_09433 [Polytolypa hystricis UAMH7299]|uniref:Uncharacterized protein n=1 Tax=Polytolypa hystricis (strain UAMH7299) TaxID=1447883 RepID=A0A2B7WQX4_POLH7|nr:hypothetical protein AJ80_09433 [Polytolypa hystricis UAMH7299]
MAPDGDPMEQTCFWMAEACFEQIRSLAPRPTERIITLEEYYNTPTISLTIKVVDGRLTAVQVPHQEAEDLTPRAQLPYTLRSSQIPLFHPSE